MKATILTSSVIIAGSFYLQKEPHVVVTTKVVEVPKIIEVQKIIEVPNVIEIRREIIDERVPILVKPNVNHQPDVEVDWDNELLTGVKYFEGFRPNTYTCSGGVETIGYGCTDKVVVSAGAITERHASDLLEQELERAKNKVDEIVTVKLTEYQRNALASFTFNVGASNLKQLVEGEDRLNSGNYDSVEDLLPLYRRAGGKIREGLVKRRRWELSLWQGEPLID